MHDLPPEIEVYPVRHLPILSAYADQLGLIGLMLLAGPLQMGAAVEPQPPEGHVPLRASIRYAHHVAGGPQYPPLRGKEHHPL